MPLGPQDPQHSDPFVGSASLEAKFPVTGGAPGSVTPAKDRNYVSSDISDELGLSDNTQGDLAPSDETLDSQHADPLYNVPGNLSQKPMPRQGFTAEEVAEGLQLSQQQQSSFPFTQVEGLVSPVAAQGSLAPEDTSVHSDVANEVPALKDISVVVRDNDPSNDSVHSDPFEGGEIHNEAPENAPADLEVSVTWEEGDMYALEFSCDAALEADEVVGWVLYEKDSNDVWNPLLVPVAYAWTNTTPNRLLDAQFVTLDNTSFGFTRSASGIFEFAVKSFNKYGNTSELSDSVTAFLVAGPETVTLESDGDASWSAIDGVTVYQYQLTLAAAPAGGGWVDRSATSVPALDLSGFDPGDTVHLFVRAKGSPRYSEDTLLIS